MEVVLAAIPLIGIGPILVIGALALFFLILAVLAWRKHKVWRVVCVLLCVFFTLGAVADYVNTRFAFYDNAAQMLGIPDYPTVDPNDLKPDPGNTAGGGGGAPLQSRPDGAVITLDIPDTASKFGSFTANVFLPPQYFSDTRAHFPVVILTHGNPGESSDWLNTPAAAQKGLAVAKAGHPTILVFPTVLQNSATGDSLCLDTAAQGNAETYLVKDVVTAIDNGLRTQPDARHRGIGGFSMGGYCALNLGLKHPDVFSVALDFSGDTGPVADTLAGGLPALFGANWQQQADLNDPTKYYLKLDASKGPAIWMDVGASDLGPLKQMQTLAPELKAKGFTVELHTRPGGHDFATWGNGLADALPWASARFYS